jgi:GTPase Era involved in 16S rRNA processing
MMVEQPPFHASTYKDAYDREMRAGTPLDIIHEQAVRNVLTTTPMALNVVIDEVWKLKAQLDRIEQILVDHIATLRAHEAGGQ